MSSALLSTASLAKKRVMGSNPIRAEFVRELVGFIVA